MPAPGGIITDKVSSHLTLRCRLHLSRVFRYQFCQQTTNNGIWIENTCPAQSGITPVPDHRSGPPKVRVRFRMPPPDRSGRPGLLRDEKNGLSRSPGVFNSSLPPSETSISYLSAVWCMSRVFAVLAYYGVACDERLRGFTPR